MTIDPFLTRRQVEAATGYSKASIYRLIEQGDFPRPIALTPRSVRWRSSDIVAWQQQKLEMGCAA